jgi:hypothetical protein
MVGGRDFHESRFNRAVDDPPFSKTLILLPHMADRKGSSLRESIDERILYGGGDREFGYRLAHAGVKPIVIRYSALCLHLDHPRGYKDAEIRKANEAIIAETLATGRVATTHGPRLG